MYKIRNSAFFEEKIAGCAKAHKANGGCIIGSSDPKKRGTEAILGS